MTLSLESRRQNIRWIQRNTEKKKHEGEAAALDNWASEGGSIAQTLKVTITPLKSRKRFICYYQRSVQHDNSHYGHQ